MLEVTQARIIKDGKPLVGYSVNDRIAEEDLPSYKEGIKSKYTGTMLSEIDVDLMYRRID